MSNEINMDMLREEVNPVFLTAQSCLRISADLGDRDAIRLRQILNFDEHHNEAAAKTFTPEMLQIVGKLMPGFHSLVEARFYTTNKMIADLGIKQVVDLPCGYTARGIKLARNGVKYFGFDLPAVADAMGPAVREVIGDNENIKYEAVDATNYASLRKALSAAEGELFITTEGMLMYFNQSELEEVFRNIRRLLLEFGGKWVTLDNTLNDTQNTVLASVIGRDAPPELLANVGKIAAGAISKTAHAENIYFDKDRSKAEQFVKDMGFDLEFISMGDYLPEILHSLDGLPEQNISEVLEAYSNVNFWVMTARPGENENLSSAENNFKADVMLNDDVLNISLSGRLDTITAPNLLSIYKQIQSRSTIGSISINMKDLDYISSAGLRVLLIMRKDIEEDKDFTIINMKNNVKEIFETTGFDGIIY